MTEFEQALLAKIDTLTEKVDTLQNEVEELKKRDKHHHERFEGFIKALSTTMVKDRDLTYKKLDAMYLTIKKEHDISREEFEKTYKYLTENLSYGELVNATEWAMKKYFDGFSFKQFDDDTTYNFKLIYNQAKEVIQLINNKASSLSYDIQRHGIR